MPKYSVTSLQVQSYEHCSEHLADNVLEIDCDVRYSWRDNALNDVSIDIDSIRLECSDGGFIELLPVVFGKNLIALKQELRKSFASDFWIERAE